MVAVDISTLMLARARRVAAARGLWRVQLVRADAHALPFVAGAFDLVLTHNGLHCYADPPRAARELMRVLKPGGAVRGSAIATGAGRRPDLVISAALRLGMFGSRLAPGEVTAWLAGAGLEDVRVEASGAVNFFSARRVPGNAPPGAPGCPAD